LETCIIIVGYCMLLGWETPHFTVNKTGSKGTQQCQVGGQLPCLVCYIAAFSLS
jgi:hypothetical protein